MQDAPVVQLQATAGEGLERDGERGSESQSAWIEIENARGRKDQIELDNEKEGISEIVKGRGLARLSGGVSRLSGGVSTTGDTPTGDTPTSTFLTLHPRQLQKDDDDGEEETIAASALSRTHHNHNFPPLPHEFPPFTPLSEEV